MRTECSLRDADLNAVWAALDACDDQGIHVYDDATMAMTYRSYAQIAKDAGRWAAVLESHGVRKGDKVLIGAETNPDFPVLWMALLWIGATPVPMPPGYALMGQYTFTERVRGILRHFRHYYAQNDDVGVLRALARGMDLDVCIEGVAQLRAQVDALPASIAVPPRATLTDDDLAFVQFTSGSTRAPKGIQVRYSNLFANVRAIWSAVGVDSARHRWISWLPLYHDMGLVGKFLGPMLTRTSLVLVSPQFFARRPLQFLQMAEQYGCQLCSMPNFGYEWILKRLGGRPQALSLAQFAWMGVGAEPVNPRAMAEFATTMAAYGLADGVVSPCYGLAEATLAVTLAPIGEGFALSRRDDETRVTCGRLVEDMEIRLDDGRILIRGPSVARSALIDGVETPLVDAEGFYDTRDLGYFDGDRLVVMGRADEMFIVNGENYFPYDIEGAARDVDGVLKRRAICFQVPASSTPVATPARVVLLYECLQTSAEELARIDDEIHAAVLGRTGLRVDVVMAVAARSIPVTPSGKLQRLRARQLFVDGYYRERAGDARAVQAESEVA